MLSFQDCEFEIPADGAGGGRLWPWIAPLVLTPCLQHWIVSFASALLCLLITVSVVISFRRSLATSQKTTPRVSLVYWASLVPVGLFGLIILASTAPVLATIFAARSVDAQLEAELVSVLSQSLNWVLFFAAIANQRRRKFEKHEFVLRFSFVLTFFLSVYLLFSASLRWGISKRYVSIWDDVVGITRFLASCFLLVSALRGNTGVSSTSTPGNQNEHAATLTEPLLANGGREVEGEEEKNGYERAGWLNKVFFMWMNPLLKTGHDSVLGLDDIPRLGKAESVETSYGDFIAEWDKAEPGKRFLPFVLIRANWKSFVFTAVLGIFKICVMYVGPLMIQQFIDFTAQPNNVWYKGAFLVAVLFLAKIVEVGCDHQYLFLSKTIGFKVWAGIVAAVYRKGLKITSASRQSHGTGKIVNYLSVDAQDLAEVCNQLHDLWQLPIQIFLALVVLYSVVGVATFAGIGTMIGTMGICLFIASKQQVYQTHIMASKDARIKVTTEALNSMKIIKLCAWQEKFLEKVESARATERIWIRKLMYLAAMSIFFLWLSPLAVSVLTFGCCVLLGIELTAGKVFTAIATFRIVQEPLRSFPQLVMQAVQAMVSVRRLKTYLESPELDPEAVVRVPNGEVAAVMVSNGEFKWEKEAETSTLKYINLFVERGSLAAIVGNVGAGKSALLACLLGEMDKMKGEVCLSGTVAYVPQTAWIQNGSIKDNILFGKSFSEVWYKKVLQVCALEGDLAQMIHGDQTEIGERGINLSGGQKQRVQLARALYQDADVYLLDDIFSALDAHTGSGIFQNCVKGILSEKTVLLVTHQVEFLHGADLILVMRDGEIVQSGKYDDLKNEGTDFAALVDAHNESLESHEVGSDDNEEEGEAQNEEDDVVLGLGGGHSSSPPVGSPGSLQRRLEREASGKLKKAGGSGKNLLKKASSKGLAPPPKSSAKLVQDEEREKGHVDWKIYWAYCTKVLYGSHIIALFFVQTCWQSLQIASDFWLANSTSAEAVANFEPRRFISVYAELAFGSGFFVLVRSLLVSFSGLRTAQKFFTDMIRSVFRAPMSFFDTTPVGRVLSRSSTDQVSVDFYIPFLYGTVLAIGFQLAGVLAVMAKVTPQMVFIIVPLSFVFILYQSYFISTSRELTRLKSITEAPIIQHFSETISGFATVRAFRHQDRFVAENTKLVTKNCGIRFVLNGANEWLGFRLEFIGTFILCSSSLILVLLPSGVIRPELVGLSLSYGLALNVCLFWIVNSISYVEQNMVAVERILQYTNITSEAPLVIEETRPDPKWPRDGSIKMMNLQMRYRADTPLVLKGVTFTVRGGEKLGVVGRTGSGKSSLIQALFRIVEPAAGSIFVDNVDITTIGLSDLRSKFSIIPQEPTLFEGNVRNNVDPLGDYSDAEIWEALEMCQLGDTVREKEGKLDSVVAENGDNWSMGQRQLFCLGRALLRKSRIVVLDEATASVDTQTDIVLQKIIGKQFAGSTVISIAHRIPSVMDSDQVLVLEAGEVKEFGSPTSLLENSKSLFSALVHEYWNRSHSTQDLDAAAE